jgi:hypothetical protein
MIMMMVIGKPEDVFKVGSRGPFAGYVGIRLEVPFIRRLTF